MAFVRICACVWVQICDSLQKNIATINNLISHKYFSFLDCSRLFLNKHTIVNIV